MKLANKFKKGLIIAMAMTSAVGTVYAAPLTTLELYETVDGEEQGLPTIEGIDDVTVQLGKQFNPYFGVTAKDQFGKNLTSKIEIYGFTDIRTPGVYELAYSVTDSQGLKTIRIRTVTVVGEESTPQWSGVSYSTVELESVFDPMAGVSVVDEKDGDITANVKVTSNVQTSARGTYLVIYEVTNSEGLTTKAYRLVVVGEKVQTGDKEEEDKEDTCTGRIDGLTDVTLKVGTTRFNSFTGVKAYDCDGNDISNTLSVSGVFDTRTPATYTHTYTAKEADGTVITGTRTIRIVE